MGTEIKRFRALFVVFLLLLLFIPTRSLALPKFSDVPGGYWAAEYISDAANAGIIYGYNDGSFRPKKQVNVQEALAMLCRAAEKAGLLENYEDLSGAHEEELTVLGFSDVKALRMPAAYFLEYGAALPSEIGEKGAKAPAKREAVALWASRIFGLKETPLSFISYKDFKDMAPNCIPAAFQMNRLGFMVGGNDGNFFPKKGITRAETAKVTMKMLSFAKSERTPAENFEINIRGKAEKADAENSTLLFSNGKDKALIKIESEAALILNGEGMDFSALRGLMGKELLLSALSCGENSVIVQTAPKIISGTVLEIKSFEDFDAFTIALDCGFSASYIAKGNDEPMPSEGEHVSFLSDGVRIIEMRETRNFGR